MKRFVAASTAYDGLDGAGLESIIVRSRTADSSNLGAIIAPTQKDLKNFGVRGMDLIVSCSFDGVPCSHK